MSRPTWERLPDSSSWTFGERSLATRHVLRVGPLTLKLSYECDTSRWYVSGIAGIDWCLPAKTEPEAKAQAVRYAQWVLAEIQDGLAAAGAP